MAIKKGLAPFHFVERQIAFAIGAAVVMIAVSLLSPRQVRRLALALFTAGIAAMAAVLVLGDEINGARRWIRFAGFSLQPSEIAKPAFVVLSAWAFGERMVRADVPAFGLAVAFLAVFSGLLMLQPDVGQAVLAVVVWGVLAVLSGSGLIWIGGFIVLAAGGLAGGYLAFEHVRWRIDNFLSDSVTAYSQTEQAYRSFIQGGLFGRGPGEGTIKTSLPDAHTDFIFAVVAEEYGVLACLASLRCLWC